MTSHVLLLWLVRHTSFWKTVRHTSTRTVLALVATWNLHCFCNRLTFEQCVWNARWSCKGKLTSRWFCWLAWTSIYPARLLHTDSPFSFPSIPFPELMLGCYHLLPTKSYEVLRARSAKNKGHLLVSLLCFPLLWRKDSNNLQTNCLG